MFDQSAGTSVFEIVGMGADGQYLHFVIFPLSSFGPTVRRPARMIWAIAGPQLRSRSRGDMCDTKSPNSCE
jgi:hypothetical protein